MLWLNAEHTHASMHLCVCVCVPYACFATKLQRVCTVEYQLRICGSSQTIIGLSWDGSRHEVRGSGSWQKHNLREMSHGARGAHGRTAPSTYLQFAK